MELPDRTLLAPALVGSASGDPRSELLRAYALALFASTAALVISLLALPFYGDDTVAVVLFLAAVGIGAWYGGFGPALMATTFGVLSIDYFFQTQQATL